MPEFDTDAAARQDAILILQKTRDGDALTPGHLQLVECVVSSGLSGLTDRGTQEWNRLIGLVHGPAGYSRDWLHDVENLTMDSQGWVYWRGQKVDHYSHNDLEERHRAAARLGILCRHLERLCIWNPEIPASIRSSDLSRLHDRLYYADGVDVKRVRVEIGVQRPPSRDAHSKTMPSIPKLGPADEVKTIFSIIDCPIGKPLKPDYSAGDPAYFPYFSSIASREQYQNFMRWLDRFPNDVAYPYQSYELERKLDDFIDLVKRGLGDNGAGHPEEFASDDDILKIVTGENLASLGIEPAPKAPVGQTPRPRP